MMPLYLQHVDLATYAHALVFCMQIIHAHDETLAATPMHVNMYACAACAACLHACLFTSCSNATHNIFQRSARKISHPVR